MSVKTYSKKTDGNTKLSANFRVREFACSDGGDWTNYMPTDVPMMNDDYHPPKRKCINMRHF